MLCATFANILFRICNQSLLLTSFIFNLVSSFLSNVAGPTRYISVFADLVYYPEMLSTLKESDVDRMAQQFNTLPRDSLQLLKSKFRDQKGWQVSYTHNENNIRTQHTQDRRISNVCARVRNRCVSPVPWSVHMQTYMRTNTDSHEDKGSSCGSDIYHRTVNLCMFIHRL